MSRGDNPFKWNQGLHRGHSRSHIIVSYFVVVVLILFHLIKSVGVYVGAGSRNESMGTTGVSYLLQKMALKGTNSMSKSEFSGTIENMGAVWNAHSDREYTSYGL